MTENVISNSNGHVDIDPREYLTITMTGARPVRIRKDLWPILTSGSGKSTGREWRMTVRQHADGRAIVYGRYSTQWEGERDKRAGTMASAGEDLVGPIDQIATELDAPEDARRECIAGLPAQELN